ncbi:MAG: hypothetical protein AAGB29_03560 [Planctomycetota bacterium]
MSKDATQGRYDTQLDLLGVLNYVFAGFLAIGSCTSVIYIGVGVAMLMGMFSEDQGEPPTFMAWLLILFSGCMMVAAWIVAVFSFLAGRALGGRRGYRLCLAAACAQCIFVPIGTGLGVFGLIVLVRPEVKARLGVDNPCVPR